ncbi:hypothetical protein BDY21DRAFT_280864, partial [Lineolata rhizophorae]
MGGRPTNQLLSPSLTNSSSPGQHDESHLAFRPHNTQFAQAHIPGLSMHQHSHERPHHLNTTVSQQQSPARSRSHSDASNGAAQQLPAHLMSPIVRVDDLSVGDSSSRDGDNAAHQRNHDMSGTHLSPYPMDEESDDESDNASTHVQVSYCPNPLAANRNEDGSWKVNQTSGQAGLGPADRDEIKEVEVPSLKEAEEKRQIAEKNAEVQEWLTKNDVGSDAGTDGSSTIVGNRRSTSGRPRAKSANDAALRSTVGLGLPDDSGLPGPGALIDEQSDLGEYDYSDDEDPAPIDVAESNTDDTAQLTQAPQADENSQTATKPWIDPPVKQEPTDSRYQPPTSSAAMMRFHQRARDIESASLAATIGSRRLSETDLASLSQVGGVTKPLPDIADKNEPKERRDRRNSFFNQFGFKRTNSNNLKRKGGQSSPSPHPPEPAIPSQPSGPKRIGSWGRPKSPKLNTNVPPSSKDVTPTSAAGATTSAGPWAQAKNVIRRSRSRSDLGRSPGLAELMTQHGGPPLPTLATPSADADHGLPPPVPPKKSRAFDDEDDEDASPVDAVTMDLQVRTIPIIPTPEGFKSHAIELNPRLVEYMVERVAQEQIRRFKRLQECKVKHLNHVRNKNCPSGKFCFALGGESKSLPPRASNKDGDVPFMGFQVISSGASDDGQEDLKEGTMVPAQFPPGVPIPPVKRLPAEFECPLCFKVKKFFKPSDWTKHVHEDVQPFTCTFPNCSEPKSFKRKADWVRHENERHRQLESWTCNINDCQHQCFRKDNFVQHLVREHKVPEPRARTGRASNKAGDNQNWGGQDHSEQVWDLVDACRNDTIKQPKDEPCRFCGNICNSWKKLTVHLAKHMEQISMPILPLVEQKNLHADSVISPVEPHSHAPSLSPARSQANFSAYPANNPSQYNGGSSLQPLDTGFSVGFSSSLPSSAVSSAAMHTYPPLQF